MRNIEFVFVARPHLYPGLCWFTRSTEEILLRISYVSFRVTKDNLFNEDFDSLALFLRRHTWPTVLALSGGNQSRWSESKPPSANSQCLISMLRIF